MTALVNKVLLGGKKSVAERIVYGALEGCREKSGTDPVVTLKRALDNVKPSLEVRPPRRRSHVPGPVEVRAGRPAPSPCAGWSATRGSAARRR